MSLSLDWVHSFHSNGFGFILSIALGSGCIANLYYLMELGSDLTMPLDYGFFAWIIF